MPRSTISPASDLLNNDGRMCGRSARGPIEVNTPASQIPTNVLRGHVVIHARDRIGVPSKPRQNGKHVAARSTSPTANGLLGIGADDKIESYQSCSENPGPS